MPTTAPRQSFKAFTAHILDPEALKVKNDLAGYTWSEVVTAALLAFGEASDGVRHRCLVRAMGQPVNQELAVATP
jgi:hypothetical protein